MWQEIKRKLFHLTSIVYVLGLVYFERRFYVSLLFVAAAAVFLLEVLRLHSPVVGGWLNRWFGSLMRPHEQRRFSGLFWMLIGVLVSVALVQPVPVAATALLYLILGDTAASLIGIRFGGPRWPGSAKRVSGSLACLAICVFIGAVLLRPAYSWHGILAGAVAATVVEWGIFPVDDNVAIPVASSLVLMLSYGLTPGF